jgi:hypothetical protein
MTDLKDVKSYLELTEGTARVNFIALKNGKLGFFAESKKTKQSVSISFTKKDKKLIKKFFMRNIR